MEDIQMDTDHSRLVGFNINLRGFLVEGWEGIIDLVVKRLPRAQAQSRRGVAALAAACSHVVQPPLENLLSRLV